ncbi:MAG: SufD family Fe-S cluster assembly protein [Candidatus Thermoplasmatota archaeon]|jgi:Fe-S cluster assembly protein SufD|nr:SufD family Fe-S cluster assembly protein [Candidatus Thermoplasmatota archaeon]
MEQYSDRLKTRLNDDAYEYRRESFISFLKSPIRDYKESPTVKDYVEITESELERMANGEPGTPFSLNQEKYRGNILVAGKELKLDTSLSKTGVDVISLSGFRKNQNPELFQHVFSEMGRERIEFLINSSWSEGLVVTIPAGKSVSLSSTTVTAADESGARKTVVICGDDSVVEYADKYFTEGNGNGVQGKNIYFILGRNAKVKYLYLQDKSSSVTDITFVRQIMEQYSEFNFYHINHGSNKVLFSDESVQNGANSDFRVYGVNFSSGTQKMDIRDSSFQVGKKSTAEIFVRGVVTGSSSTIHRGNIDLEEVSINSSGFYDSKILLLSKDGYANSKPGLMIKNSNTRSKHGSSISNVDPEQIFYLRSRGIDIKTARNIITGGFVGSMIERANNREFTEKINEYAESLDIDAYF